MKAEKQIELLNKRKLGMFKNKKTFLKVSHVVLCTMTVLIITFLYSLVMSFEVMSLSWIIVSLITIAVLTPIISSYIDNHLKKYQDDI